MARVGLTTERETLEVPWQATESPPPARQSGYRSSMHFIGVDLSWGEGTPAKPANETGLACIDDTGRVLDAGWARGYANPSNLIRPWSGGVTLRRRLEQAGFAYTDGRRPPRPDRVEFFECYPYTTLVGAPELGYGRARPRYKRFDRALPTPAARRAFRAAECDDLLQRMLRLATATPPLDLRTHPVTASLTEHPSPLLDAAYKHREDLLDATLCAWTAALWAGFGTARCQVLGAGDSPDEDGRVPVIIAPARPEQRPGPG